MKHSVESSNNSTAVIGIALTVLFMFLFVWFIRSLPPSSGESSATPQEAAQYEEYKSDQLLNENAEQEACMDQEARDVERYGEGAADTYNCTK